MSNFSFGSSPTVSFRRSKFDLSHGIKTTCNVGQLIPIECQEVLPGDTFKSKVTMVSRVTSSFIKPVMDNLFADIHHFFIPGRLCYDDFEKVFGNPKPSSYTQDNFATVPTTTSGGTVSSGTIADYLGLPVGSLPAGISLLPFRAYGLVYNTWFRNENVIDEVLVNTGEANSTEATFNNNAFSASNYMGKPAYVSRRKDLFSACLPAPQKGVAPTVPFGTSAPIVPTQELTDAQKLAMGIPVSALRGSDGKSLITPTDPTSPSGSPLPFAFGSDLPENAWDQSFNLAFRGTMFPLSSAGALAIDSTMPSGPLWQVTGSNLGLTYKNIGDNLKVDLTSATSANINDIRMLFALQRMLEVDARGGTRYNEVLRSHFGVTSPDARLQLPEYLGGSRVPLSVTQVAQTSEATDTSPLANVAGYSLTNGSSRFTKGFVEHGYVMSFVVIRQMHTYQQGVEKMWLRTKREEFYDPKFANLGELPVWQSELYAVGKSDLKDHVFGYNEAWAEYRYRPSKVTGQMRSGLVNTLDVWHFADVYANAPTLSATFIEEQPGFVDRTLSVPSTSQDQFILDFWFDESAIRVMPTYSIPGLIDHH